MRLLKARTRRNCASIKSRRRNNKDDPATRSPLYRSLLSWVLLWLMFPTYIRLIISLICSRQEKYENFKSHKGIYRKIRSVAFCGISRKWISAAKHKLSDVDVHCPCILVAYSVEWSRYLYTWPGLYENIATYRKSPFITIAQHKKKIKLILKSKL